MNQSQLSRQRPGAITIAAGTAIAVLALWFSILCVGATSAHAFSEYNFCWGVTLGKKGSGSNESCSAPGGFSHLNAIYGNGDQHSVCVEGWATGTTKCSSGAGTGVYNNSFPGYYDVPLIRNNGESTNKVYAVAYYTAEESPPPPPPPPAPSWTLSNLGGNITSDPDLSSWGYGRLDMFAKGSENNLMHRAYSGGSWGSWESLGGTLASGPSAVSWGSNRIDVVARATDNTVLHWWYDGSKWSSDNLGGNITSDPDIASRGSGRLDVFARGSDGKLNYKYYNGGSWSWWENLGGSMVGGPGAAAWDSTSVFVAGRLSDNSTIFWGYEGAGWGTMNLGGNITSDPDMSSRGSKRLDVFARGSDGKLNYRYYNYAAGGWSWWENLGGSLIGGPGAVSWDSKDIYVVGRLADNTVLMWGYH